MQKQLLSTGIKAAIPLILGFVGGSVSLFWPTYFQAFCTGSL